MLKPQNNFCRTLISLNGIWDYSKICDTPEKGFTPQGKLAVPASWNEQHNELYHHKGRLWYQYRFTVPALPAGKRALLRFAGLLYRAEFFFNGEKLGEDNTGLMPVEFDVTEKLSPSGNLLVVGVDGDRSESQAIGHGDFYEYGGIHRPVTLEIVNEKRITDIKAETFCSGVLKLRWKNSGGEKIRFSIKGITAVFDAKCGQGEMVVPDVTPWTPEVPQLYPLSAELLENETLCDTYTLKTGFRTFEVSGRDLLLNGKKISMDGFCRHEDFYVIGKGVNDALNIRDFELMKWCGANSFRTSHYPYCEEILELADELGFMVIDELPFSSLKQNHMADKELQANARIMVRTLIDRDFNHPSVVSWSLGNECQIEVPESEEFFRIVSEEVRAADPVRPTTLVAFTRPGEDHAYKFADIVGINRYYGWYGYPQWGSPGEPGDLTRAIELLSEELDKFSALIEKPFIITEFGADCIEGHHSMFALQFTEEFQAEFLKRYIKHFQQRSDVAGMHIWHFADFSTNQLPLRVQGNRKGIFSRNREPKIAAFAVRQAWTGKDGLGLLPLGEK